MQYIIFINLTIAFSFLSSVIGLGINCRGSGFCPSILEDLITDFSDAILHGNSTIVGGGPMNDSDIYYDGYPQDITCDKHYTVCLFMQGNVPVGGVNGSVIKARITDLRNHGCKVCGSVPLSGDNDPDKMGILTSNMVNQGSCDGVCQGFDNLEP